MKIYVASSWRNQYQQAIVDHLRSAGHEVYDFRNPRPGDKGFSWSAIDSEWLGWSVAKYRKALDHPVAQAGFDNDFDAMKWADACVLVLPCGRSAHVEAGWMQGSGRRVIVLQLDRQEPELMYKLFAHICLDVDELLKTLAEIDRALQEEKHA